MSAATVPPASFDVLGPLHEGTTLLEASAGTGKTYCITSLYVRLVIEQDIPPERVLALTFGRAAAGELQSRVRDRLVDARAALGAAIAGTAPAPGDRVLRALVTGEPDAPGPLPAVELRARHARASRALAQLDRGGIATIHGFCLEAARRRAFSLDVPFGSKLVEDDRPAVDELVDDFLSRTLATATAAEARTLRETARLSREELRALARAILGRPDAAVLPAPMVWDPHDRSIVDDVARFRTEWREAGETAYVDAVTRLHAEGVLKGRTFGRTKTRELFAPLRDRLASLNAWLEADAPASGRIPPGKGLGRADLVAHLAPERTLPTVPAIEEVDAFLERVTAAQLDAPRAGFLCFLQQELPRRRARARQLGHDDVLRTLREGLRRPPPGAVAALIRDAYDVALIDEFQDTDPTQWAIFRELFLDAPGKRLFLVGDPKQAIYAFRGADVQVYVEACRRIPPDRHGTLGESFRSDGALVHALDTTYRDRGAVFEEDVPRYVPMRAAKGRHPWTALRGRPGSSAPAALRLRWFDAHTWDPASPSMTIAKGVAGERVPALLAHDVARALGGELRLGDAADDPGRPLRASDVAVLVRTNAQAAAVQAALRDQGIHAVIAATGNVFHSDEATWLRTFLDALTDPREALARTFALSPLGGFSVAALHRATAVEATDDRSRGDAARWLALLDGLADDRRTCASRGIAVALRACLERDQTLLPRLARSPDGERCLTNLRHLEELLHTRELAAGRGIGALAAWFWAQQADPRSGDGESELRLEADRDAVRVTTMHRSKGLEYPVVFLPYAWDGALARSGDVARVFHERDPQGHPTSQLVVDTRRGDPRPHGERNASWARDEALAESLRLFYVALTRARHHVVVYVGAVTAQGGTGGLATSPIGVLLHGGRDPACAPRTRSALAAADIAARLATGQRTAFEDVVRRLIADADENRPPGAPDAPCIAWSAAPFVAGPPAERITAPSSGGVNDLPALDVAPFSRGAALTAGSGYARASYTSLTARRTHGPAPSSDAVANPSREGGDEPAETALPLGRFARGAAVGIYVHALLERLDFRTGREREDRRTHAPAPPGRGRALEDFTRDEARVHGVAPADAAKLATALPGILASPLGEDAGGIRLADLAPEDRLDELGFDLAIGGGHAYRGTAVERVSAAALGGLLATPRGASPSDDREGLPWPRSYTEALRAGALGFTEFGGFLTGSLDLVYRIATRAGHRYFVADYKTNWLGVPDEDGVLVASPRAYRREGLVAEMVKHHYFVQANLYLVALHRFLRTRLGDRYDYDEHVGGAVYLFLRGMGEGRGPGAGVFVERPPRHVIEALDAAFGASRPARGAVS